MTWNARFHKLLEFVFEKSQFKHVVAMMIVLYANMCVVIPLLRARVVKILLITTQTNSCLYKKIIEYIHKNLKDIKYFSTVQGIHKLIS